MKNKIIIYGTDTCPFCIQAREAYKDRVIFINVENNQKKLEEMLVLSGGRRAVPVMLSVCNVCNRSRVWYSQALTETSANACEK